MIDWFINLNCVLEALVASLFTFLLTVLGASIVFFFKKVNKNIMDAMMGVSSGVMLSAAFFSLLMPSIEMSNSLGQNTLIVLICGFMCGGLFLFIFDKIFSKVDKSSKRVMMLILSITLHNIPEGLCVGIAFGSLIYNIPGSTLINSVMLALGIGIQNFPEGSAISLPLKREGLSNKKAFLIGSLSGVVEPIAGVLGALLVLKIKAVLPFFLSFAAGCMIYVVVEELIPESQTNENKSLMALFTLIGFSLMMILDLGLG